jgi:hypothetical protein
LRQHQAGLQSAQAEKGAAVNPLATDQNKAALVFVYNADSGIFSAAADVAHKIFSPQTYPCRLCALTHSAFRMRDDWKRFLDALGRPLEFLHADELRARYKQPGVGLPAIFEKRGGGLTLWLDADSINGCRTTNDLKLLITDKLRAEP